MPGWDATRKPRPFSGANRPEKGPNTNSVLLDEGESASYAALPRVISELTERIEACEKRGQLGAPIKICVGRLTNLPPPAGGGGRHTSVSSYASPGSGSVSIRL